MQEIYLVVLAFAIIVALASAFIILLISKVGMRDEVITRAPKLISQLFGCDFCLSFWISLILAIILAIIFRELYIVLTPIMSTPISRFLL